MFYAGAMGAADRFHDPGARLEEYLDEVLVRCPRCAGPARVAPAPVDRLPRRGTYQPPSWLADRRLVCAGCALVRTWPAPGAKRRCVTGTDRDPWFGEQLWLRADVSGNVLWAYNHRHLDAIAGYVAATHRTRDLTPGTIHTMLNRLPAWIKSASHREAILAAVTRLRAATPG